MRPAKKTLLKGSIENKMKQIERLLWHLKVRRGNYVIGVTPPIPVFDYISQPTTDGVVFRKIMPANGVITVGCMWLDEFDRAKQPMATLSVDDRVGGSNVSVPVNKRAIRIQPSMAVQFGQRISLSINPVDSCAGIWTAFLFEIEPNQLSADKRLMSGFLELADMAVEELDNA